MASLNPASALANAADCLGTTNSGTGTYLAAPMAAAREMLAGTCPPSSCAGPVGARPGVKKGIIFMTDGQPNESTDPGGGYPYNSDGAIACDNVVSQANQAKAAGITVVTVAFRLEGVECASGDTSSPTGSRRWPRPRRTASPVSTTAGAPDPAATHQTKVDGENGDLDFFFCTPQASQLEAIFQSAAKPDRRRGAAHPAALRSSLTPRPACCAGREAPPPARPGSR